MLTAEMNGRQPYNQVVCLYSTNRINKNTGNVIKSFLLKKKDVDPTNGKGEREALELMARYVPEGTY